MVFTLSGRGQKNASAGAEFLGFAGENPYDAETNPSGKISLGPADNVSITIYCLSKESIFLVANFKNSS